MEVSETHIIKHTTPTKLRETAILSVIFCVAEASLFICYTVSPRFPHKDALMWYDSVSGKGASYEKDIVTVCPRKEFHLRKTFLKWAEERLKQLESRIQEADRELQQLPAGKLLVSSNGKNRKLKWFNKLDGKKYYLRPKQVDVAKQLARRRYLEALVADLKQEQRAIQLFINNYPLDTTRSNKVLNKNGFRDLLSSYFEAGNAEARMWAESSYVQSTYKLEEKIYKAADGNFYRSKSETVIASALYKHGIPFRYEEELQLPNGNTIYPDFKIKHPRTGEIYIWEHLGMMDIPVYRRKSMFKLINYSDMGYILNDNLIITTESKGVFLDAEEIEDIIQKCFL